MQFLLLVVAEWSCVGLLAYLVREHAGLDLAKRVSALDQELQTFRIDSPPPRTRASCAGPCRGWPRPASDHEFRVSNAMREAGVKASARLRHLGCRQPGKHRLRRALPGLAGA